MERLTRLIKKFSQIHRLSKIAIKIGFSLMICLYIIAVYAYAIAPHSPDYLYSMSVYRGSLEAAPACLAVGICAGLLGDLMLRRGRGDEDSSGKS